MKAAAATAVNPMSMSSSPPTTHSTHKYTNLHARAHTHIYEWVKDMKDELFVAEVASVYSDDGFVVVRAACVPLFWSFVCLLS